jgi:hypothetical protein
MICRLTLCIFVAFTTVAHAEDDPVQARVSKAKAAYEAALEKHKESALGWFNSRERLARNVGDKKTLDQIESERGQFEENGLLPRSAPALLRTEATRIRNTLEGVYEAAVRDYTRLGLDEKATLIDGDLQAIRAAKRAAYVTRFDDAVFISAKTPQGYVVGKVLKGDVLTLQYVSGKWKGWGVNATASPDDVVEERPGVCRVAICSFNPRSGPQTLALVPPNTISNPFQWTADQNYEQLIFRINDNDGNFASNPDARVKYQLSISSPR